MRGDIEERRGACLTFRWCCPGLCTVDVFFCLGFIIRPNECIAACFVGEKTGRFAPSSHDCDRRHTKTPSHPQYSNLLMASNPIPSVGWRPFSKTVMTTVCAAEENAANFSPLSWISQISLGAIIAHNSNIHTWITINPQIHNNMISFAPSLRSAPAAYSSYMRL